ncbi:hypothetical protein BDB01DRAFT_910119 [Pilobolus umbonatus]|nr:hypothetical protein BDB01DRAFT_910119 [Pilobolus umbonatus]
MSLLTLTIILNSNRVTKKFYCNIVNSYQENVNSVAVELPKDGQWLIIVPNKTYNTNEYPFFINKEKLAKIGDIIAKSRTNIPTSFQGSWDYIFKKLDGVRMSKEARKALEQLSKGCGLALQWTINDKTIRAMAL